LCVAQLAQPGIGLQADARELCEVEAEPADALAVDSQVEPFRAQSDTDVL
jgi:hypothetical protein